MSARLKSETEANQLFEQIEPMLKDTLVRMHEGDPTNMDCSTSVTLLSLLGFGHEFLGKALSRPSVLFGGITDRSRQRCASRCPGYASVRDQFACDHRLRDGDPTGHPARLALRHARTPSPDIRSLRGVPKTVRTCARHWRLCCSRERGFRMDGYRPVQLGFPADMVRTSFDNAIYHDPSNERAKRNLAAFEAASRPVTWETRTVTALRTSGLAERRYAVAA